MLQTLATQLVVNYLIGNPDSAVAWMDTTGTFSPERTGKLAKPLIDEVAITFHQ